jgi:N-acyl-D-amino-acid deacylase
MAIDNSFEAAPDTVIYGGTVYDGTGSDGVQTDIAIQSGKIVEIGPALQERYPHARPFDATNCAVTPGFIDIHTHSDLSVLKNHEMRSSVHQGVTTELGGNCGISPGLLDMSDPAFEMEQAWMKRMGLTPDWKCLSDFLGRIETEGVSENIGVLAGHGTIRKAILGFSEEPPNDKQLAAMQAMTVEALEAGAFGLSTGLEYLPGGHAKPDEIAALAKLAHEAGGFYASHMRSEGDELIECVADTIGIGERTGIPVQISHHKAEGHKNWGKVKTTLQMMQAARSSGLDVLTDQYPYTAFMTGLSVILLPDWARGGSAEDMDTKLRDPEIRAKIEAEIAEQGFDFNAIQIGVSSSNREAQGKTLAELAKPLGKNPITVALDMLLAEESFIAAAHFALNEDDVELVMNDPHTMIGSDGVATAPGAPEKPHPRSYGTFPRVLSRYVRDRKVLPLQEAIRRMTSLPASRLKLTDRGKLHKGYNADITVFHPDTVQDNATFAEPHQFPTGIEYVFVNGVLTVSRGEHTGARAGKVLRRR